MIDQTVKLNLNNTALAIEIVAAYVSNNSVRASDLPRLISDVHASVAGLASGGVPTEASAPTVERATPAQVRKSIQPNGLVSFIDGKSYKTMKRHLTANGLTPEKYRRAYGLPDDYPVVCASYSDQRSILAKQIGLGVPGGRAASAAAGSPGRRKAA